jgi:CheY-like chemotaxis protein
MRSRAMVCESPITTADTARSWTNVPMGHLRHDTRHGWRARQVDAVYAIEPQQTGRFGHRALAFLTEFLGRVSGRMSQSSFDPSRRSVVAVDDEPAVTQLISRVLEREGYDVRTAASAEEALELIDQRPADLFIVDKNLPRMHGFELVRQLRARFPNLPVIVITAAPEPFAPLHERIDGYLAKPFRSLSALRETVADAFERSRVARERQDLQRRLNEVVAQLNNARKSP